VVDLVVTGVVLLPASKRRGHEPTVSGA